MIIDRREANRALARAIALHAMGRDDEAHDEAAKLVDQLRDAGILRNDDKLALDTKAINVLLAQDGLRLRRNND